MFERKDEIQQAIDAVYEVLVKLKRGDILTHVQIGEVLGVRPHEYPWDHVVYGAFDRLLTEKGIAYWHVRTVGYELLTPQRTLEIIPQKRTMKAYRQFRKIRRSVEALPEKGLSLHQRRFRHFAIDQANAGMSAARRAKRDLMRQLRPTSTLPRPPVAAEK
jgi:hypothetical protein